MKPFFSRPHPRRALTTLFICAAPLAGFGVAELAEPGGSPPALQREPAPFPPGDVPRPATVPEPPHLQNATAVIRSDDLRRNCAGTIKLPLAAPTDRAPSGPLPASTRAVSLTWSDEYCLYTAYVERAARMRRPEA